MRFSKKSEDADEAAGAVTAGNNAVRNRAKLDAEGQASFINGNGRNGKLRIEVGVSSVVGAENALAGA